MIFNFLIWLDIKVFRLITLGRAKQGETISAAAWNMHLSSRWQGKLFVPLIDFLFIPWGPNHCRDAYMWQLDIYQKASSDAVLI
jgi:hypothetical protein